MKANELMIGDYLRINRDGLCIKKGSVVEVRGIDADDKLIEKGLISSTHCHPFDDNQFDGGIWCDYLDPIPLTPEILERNGFEKTCCGLGAIIYTVSDDNEYYAIAIDEYTDSIWRFEYTNCEINFPLVRIMVCYVHELQHALRLCGIEQEIKL